VVPLRLVYVDDSSYRLLDLALTHGRVLYNFKLEVKIFAAEDRVEIVLPKLAREAHRWITTIELTTNSSRERATDSRA
jgi:hypothetical protein